LGHTEPQRVRRAFARALLCVGVVAAGLRHSAEASCSVKVLPLSFTLLFVACLRSGEIRVRVADVPRCLLYKIDIFLQAPATTKKKKSRKEEKT
jgi:hypothetical protein